MLRCKIKGYRGSANIPKVKCNNNKCNIQVHLPYFQLLKTKTTIPDNFGNVICLKHCYNMFVKEKVALEKDANKQRRNR